MRELKLRIAFDGQIFAAQRFGGVSRYFVELVGRLASRPEIAARVFAPVHVNEYLTSLDERLRVGLRTSVSTRIAQVASMASTPVVMAMLGSWRPDVVHWTYYFPQADVHRRARKILTVYDMIHELRPGDFSDGGAVARWKERAVRRADHVICISESTRRDLLERYPVDPRRVSVTHLGHSALHIDPAHADGAAFRRSAFSADVPYVLHVGSRGGYKNFAGLLQAFAASGWLRREFGVLCFGSGPFTDAERAMIAGLGLETRVRWVGGSDGVLAAAYRHAALFVYPSMYEGFGIPPLEAMSLGCPVACGRTSSLPEVVGDAAALFDPERLESMTAVMEGVLGSREARAALVSRGSNRVGMFSWERCAMQTQEIYERVIQR